MSLKEMLSQEHSIWRSMIPVDVTGLLLRFENPDVFAVYGGDDYISVQKALFTALSSTGNALNVEALKQHITGPRHVLQALSFNTTQVSYQPEREAITKLKAFLDQTNTLNEQHRYMMMCLMNKEFPLEISTSSHLLALIVHIYTALTGKNGALSPLSMICDKPAHAKKHYLPTMPDNPYEVARDFILADAEAAKDTYRDHKAFKCPNGHIYFIINCGRPVQKSKCPDCGVPIGSAGKYNVAAAGNTPVDPSEYASKCGYILGSANKRQPNAVTERELPPLPWAILRCLVHLAMMASAISNKQDVHWMVEPRPPGSIYQFLLEHIQLDLRQIADCSGRSRDDCYNLLHIIIHLLEVEDTIMDEPVKLESIKQRREWELSLYTKYLEPNLNNNTQALLHEFNQALAGQDQDVNDSLDKSLKARRSELNEHDILRTDALWNYRKPITMGTSMNQLSNDTKPDAYPLLKKFLNMTEQLRVVNLLPSVLKLMKIITDKFHCRISRTQARTQSLEEFLVEHQNLALEKLVDDFMQAWNVMIQVKESPLQKLSKRGKLESILPRGNQSNAQMLVTFLVDTHNSLVDSERLTTASQHLLAITTSNNLICLQSDEGILSIIHANVEYELKETTTQSFAWDVIQAEVYAKYISQKSTIVDFTLPTFQYPDDFTMSGLFDKILHKQIRLDPNERAIISDQYGGRVPDLTDSLAMLKKVVNFIGATARTYKPDQKLFEYMSESLGLKKASMVCFTAAVGDCNLKHLTGLWTLLSFEKSKTLVHKHQEPFDDICNQCFTALEDNQEAQLLRLFPPQRESTRTLLYYLYEYIILKLNRSTEERQGLEALNLDNSLQQELQTYLWERYGEEDTTADDWAQIPDEVKVTQVIAMWKLICHAQQDEQ